MGLDRTFSSYIKPEFMWMLPRDVQREILELAAYLYPLFAVRMSTTSKELQAWAERIIYRDLYFNSEQRWGGTDELVLSKFRVVLKARPADFFEQHVQALHFEGKFSYIDIFDVLQVCTGVTNLGIYADYPDENVDQIFEVLTKLPLRSLFIGSRNLSASKRHISGSSKSTSLSSVTHLCLVDGWDYPANLFPALTHLAIVPDYQHASSFVQYVRAILQNPNIQSVVVTHPFVNALDHFDVVQGLRDVTDDRLVLFTLPWTMTKFIEDDLWDLACTFPDEDQGFSLTFLDELPNPKILTFEEMMEAEKAQENQST